MNKEEVKSKVNEMIEESFSVFSLESPEQTLKILFKAWEFLPEEKTDWDESYLLSKYITHVYFRTSDFEKATEWCDTFLTCDEAQRDFGESEFMKGKIDFEKGNKESAKKYFEAELTFLTTEEGGRKRYAASGYRPQIEFMKIRGVLTSGQQTYLNKDIVYPGEKVKATITTLMSDFLVGMLQTGDEFTFNEGARLIGHGIITKILRKELNFDQIPSGVITSDIIDQFHQQPSTDSIKEIDFDSPLGLMNQISKDFEIAEKLSNKLDYLKKLHKLIDRLSDSDETKQKIKHITRAKKS